MTWHNNGSSSKIDRIYLTANFPFKLIYCEISQTTKSDHNAVFAQFFSNLNKPSPPLFNPWKLNDKILDREEVIQGIKSLAAGISSLKDSHGKMWYDLFIKNVCDFLKKISIEISKENNSEKKNLFRRLESFNKIKFNSDLEYKECKEILAKDLSAFYEGKRKSLEKLVRDERLKFVKHPTKVLINSIVKKQNKNELSKYICSDHRVTTDTNEILDDINDYYQNLLGVEKISEEKISGYEFKSPKLEDSVKITHPKLGEKISFNEAYEVILAMRDSAPGINGLTIAFFKKFFPLFGESFIEILNDDGCLPNTFNETIIKLIPKNDIKTKSINDLRPISLTNFEYRIFTKILVNRFNKIGPFLFQDTQTCSVRGRRINDSINAIKDVIDDANLKKIEAFIVSVKNC